MHLPLVISDCDASDENDDNSRDDVKITTREQKMVVLMTFLVIIDMIISDSLDIEEVLLMNNGGNRFALIVLFGCYTVTYSYIFLSLIGVLFFGKLGRIYRELFQFLTLLLLLSRVVLIAMLCSFEINESDGGGDFHPI